MPGKPPAVLPISAKALRRLEDILHATDEFPYHDGVMFDPCDSQQHDDSDDPEQQQQLRAATVLHIVSLCRNFKKAFTLNAQAQN